MVQDLVQDLQVEGLGRRAGQALNGMASSILPNKEIFQERDGIFDGLLGYLAEYLNIWCQLN